MANEEKIKLDNIEDVNDIELEITTEEDVQNALRQAFGALSTEEERREGKRVICAYMHERGLKQLEFEDPDTGVTKLARYFPQRTSLEFDQSVLKQKYPDIYKECMVIKTKSENLWISKSKHSKK